MIPKIICFIIGHILREKVFTGKQYDCVDNLTGQWIKGNYFVWRDCEKCPRCGKTI